MQDKWRCSECIKEFNWTCKECEYIGDYCERCKKWFCNNCISDGLCDDCKEITGYYNEHELS